MISYRLFIAIFILPLLFSCQGLLTTSKLTPNDSTQAINASPSPSSTLEPESSSSPSDKTSLVFTKTSFNIPAGFCDGTSVLRLDLFGRTRCNIHIESRDPKIGFAVSYNLLEAHSGPGSLIESNKVKEDQTIEIEVPLNTALNISEAGIERVCGRCYEHGSGNVVERFINGKLNQTITIKDAQQTITLESPTFPNCQVPEPPDCFPDSQSHKLYYHPELFTTVSGVIYNDAKQPLEQAIVTIRSLNSSVAYEKTFTTSKDGKYSFALVPAGIQIEFIINKKGYAEQSRLIQFEEVKDKTHQIDFALSTS